MHGFPRYLNRSNAGSKRFEPSRVHLAQVREGQHAPVRSHWVYLQIARMVVVMLVLGDLEDVPWHLDCLVIDDERPVVVVSSSWHVYCTVQVEVFYRFLRQLGP